MTDLSEFERAFTKFRSMPYPEYPRLADLQDWNSRLLTLDSHIAGYASRVYRGDLSACDVPNIENIVAGLSSLKDALEYIKPVSSEDARLINDYREYILALECLTVALTNLASQN